MPRTQWNLDAVCHALLTVLSTAQETELPAMVARDAVAQHFGRTGPSISGVFYKSLDMLVLTDAVRTRHEGMHHWIMLGSQHARERGRLIALRPTPQATEGASTSVAHVMRHLSSACLAVETIATSVAQTCDNGTDYAWRERIELLLLTLMDRVEHVECLLTHTRKEAVGGR